MSKSYCEICRFYLWVSGIGITEERSGEGGGGGGGEAGIPKTNLFSSVLVATN